MRELRMTFVVLAGCMILSVLPVSAQKLLQRSIPISPEWLQHKLPEPANTSYHYQSVEGEGQSLQEAREACLLEVSTYVRQEYRIRRNTKTEILFSEQEERMSSVFVFDVEGETLKIKVSKADEFWEWWEYPGGEKRYRCFILYAVSENADKAVISDLKLTTGYGARGMWRSMIVPGWGQFYKGSRAKGACLLGSEVLLVGGIVIGENLRRDYIDKARRTLNVDFRRSYMTKADNWKNVRNACLAGAAALYVYNVIDAIVAAGMKRAVGHRFTLSPHLAPGEGGVTLGYCWEN